MSRLVWTEELDGWHSGRYQIELAAPHLWVLTRLGKRADDPEMTGCKVLKSAGSLRGLKRAAAELEWARERRRRLLIHLGIMTMLAAFAVLAALLEWDLAIPAVVAVFALALRILVLWVEGTTGSPWSVLSEHYQ
ncbi:MAG: hypothetical protein ACRDX9_14545 [Acidimicrobiia bacterium]